MIADGEFCRLLSVERLIESISIDHSRQCPLVLIFYNSGTSLILISSQPRWTSNILLRLFLVPLLLISHLLRYARKFEVWRHLFQIYILRGDFPAFITSDWASSSGNIRITRTMMMLTNPWKPVWISRRLFEPKNFSERFTHLLNSICPLSGIFLSLIWLQLLDLFPSSSLKVFVQNNICCTERNSILHPFLNLCKK